MGLLRRSGKVCGHSFSRCVCLEYVAAHASGPPACAGSSMSPHGLYTSNLSEIAVMHDVAAHAQRELRQLAAGMHQRLATPPPAQVVCW